MRAISASFVIRLAPIIPSFREKAFKSFNESSCILISSRVFSRRHRFDIVLVAAFDRVARSVRHFLEVLDEFNHLGITFISLRENIDTAGPLGRAVVVIVGAIAELERSLIVERVRAGMRRAKLEGRRIGRAPLDIDRAALLRDRQRGLSLNQLARAYKISKASVCRVLKEGKPPVSIASIPTASPSIANQELAPLKMTA